MAPNEKSKTNSKTLIPSSTNTITRARPSATDEFGRSTAKIAVAQLCEATGFHAVKDSALESFSDIVIRYLIDFSKTAKFYSNLAGRSQCTVFDLLRAWEDLQAPLGFSNGMKEIMNYAESMPETPFAQPIPNFPVIRERKIIPSFIQMGETPPGKHIPAWLPALPDPHTYIHTPVWDERVSDPREDKVEQARQRRKAERSLLNLQKRLLLCNGNRNRNESTEPTTTRSDPDEDVAPVVLPVKLPIVDRDRVSVMEAFAPAIEKLGGSGVLCEDDEIDGEKTAIPAATARPTVHFKFKSGKKFIGESLDDRNKKRDALHAIYLVGREDERDDKKRRAEYILRQSMENRQELTLL